MAFTLYLFNLQDGKNFCRESLGNPLHSITGSTTVNEIVGNLASESLVRHPILPVDHNSGCSYSRTAALHLVNEICHSNGEEIGCIPSPLCVDCKRLAWKLIDMFVDTRSEHHRFASVSVMVCSMIRTRRE